MHVAVNHIKWPELPQDVQEGGCVADRIAYMGTPEYPRAKSQDLGVICRGLSSVDEKVDLERAPVGLTQEM